MEDHRDQFIAIIAGYEEEMDWFLTANPGLPSRFPIHLSFPDYDVKSLVEIARRTAATRQYSLSPDAELKLQLHLKALFVKRTAHHFSNARWVRNTLERAIRNQAMRLFDTSQLSRGQAMTLVAQDFTWEVEER